MPIVCPGVDEQRNPRPDQHIAVDRQQRVRPQRRCMSRPGTRAPATDAALRATRAPRAARSARACGSTRRNRNRSARGRCAGSVVPIHRRTSCVWRWSNVIQSTSPASMPTLRRCAEHIAERTRECALECGRSRLAEPREIRGAPRELHVGRLEEQRPRLAVGVAPAHDHEPMRQRQIRRRGDRRPKEPEARRIRQRHEVEGADPVRHPRRPEPRPKPGAASRISSSWRPGWGSRATAAKCEIALISPSGGGTCAVIAVLGSLRGGETAGRYTRPR